MTNKQKRTAIFKRMQARQLAEQRRIKPYLRPKGMKNKKNWQYKTKPVRVE